MEEGIETAAPPSAEDEIAQLDKMSGGCETGGEAGGCAGSDSGVETCGRALSSGGGSRSCASSVVSCGSACGSESSSLLGAAPRPRRRVAVADPPRPLGASTPRVVPRGPNLATRERARSREKPIPPEKPKPPTPKPRARPPADLPALTRESPALRVKQTRTSTARCRPATPSSPTAGVPPRLAVAADPNATRAAADKYGTLPRRRRETDRDESSRRGASASRDRDSMSTSLRRSTLSRTASTRGAPRPRVRIYAEAESQTALVSGDIEAALAGRAVRTDVLATDKVSRGVQAERRDAEMERLETRLARALADAEEERVRRAQAEAEAREERALRTAAQDELERNTQRLLELSGAGGGGGTECLLALEEQLRAAATLAEQHRAEIDALRETCRRLQVEKCGSAEAARALERRLAAAETEAGELHEFLCAEKSALQEQLRDTEQQLAHTSQQLERRHGECRQLVRLCERRRQEALAAAAHARGSLRHAARRLRALRDSLCQQYRVQPAHIDDTEFNNVSCSDSGGATPDEPGSWWRSEAGSESRDDDISADLLDSETEPRADIQSEGATGEESCQTGGWWSGEELSPVRDEAWDRGSLHRLCDAILHRQVSESQPHSSKVTYIEKLVWEIVRVCRTHAERGAGVADRECVNGTEDVKETEVHKPGDKSNHHNGIFEKCSRLMENLQMTGETLDPVPEAEVSSRYRLVDECLSVLGARQPAVSAWPELAALQRQLETLAFGLLRPDPRALSNNAPALASH